MPNETILAIDPGLSSLGWAVLETHAKKIKVTHTGVIKANKHASRVKYRELTQLHGQRLISLEYLNDHVDDLIREYNVTSVAIEDAFMNIKFPNAYSALVQVIHTISWLAYNTHKIRTFVVPTKVAKLSLAGSGSSGKINVLESIHTQDDLVVNKSLEIDEHIADAIAVGYAIIKHNFILPKKHKKGKRK